MVTTIKLVTRTLYIVAIILVVRTVKIYSLGNFQIYNTVLLTTVTMLYIISPKPTHLITESFYHLTIFTHFPKVLLFPFSFLFLYCFNRLSF